jgi:trimeric autotransporter adhesin
MLRSWFAVVVGALAVSLAGCGSSASSSSVAGASPAAQTACGAIAEGSASSIAACAQGYDAAKAGKPEEKTCSKVGSGAIVVGENVKDCLAGWAAADAAGKTASASPSAAAQTACGGIAEGSSGAIAACAQGYDGAKVGKPESTACDSVGSGAVIVVENVSDCHAGWAAAGTAGKIAAASPSAAAQTACGAIAEGSASSIAACTQGYDAAKAGKPESTACDSVGSGAVVVGENVKDCRAGWSAG